ncbi:sarcosine oxidase subunit gamma [Roseovarius sp. LXJ103]|uniref:sarcosine oxidase subunit gamma n=1 Tax=Roseovarius carneus TaxID=2853164 RepID=UPI000D620361|nr:sarcosine oxidase subunit gamma family protein [Roseovarius carneus]MBZ8117210.1 sarcosine oxidase subunit gamma [Roseovarius carneus]PWE36956.1 sarcosine oxidase subunit gamma [Pelagicola sp. LXJ1103]
MPDFTLTAAPPLAGTHHSIDGATLTAPEGLAIVSLALPLGAEDKAEKAIKTAFGALPDIGKAAEAKGHHLLRMGVDQAFVIFDCATPEAEPKIAAKLKGAAYTTDQTDAWCILQLSGPRARDVLERICMVDLHPDTFPVGALARTIMEHMGSIVVRSEADTYLLLSASSSAKSFAHAVELSMDNIS